jgi:GT2 family glycosyltransferase
MNLVFQEYKMSIKVSIVIPVRNNLHFTQKCLESIALSPPQVGYEIIVVDNASDDGTHEFLKLKKQYGELDFHRNSIPQNFSASCNQGAHMSMGNYLLFLNNDIEAFPGWLDAMVEVAERQQRIGAVGAKLIYPDGTIQHAGVAFHYFRKIRKYGPYHIFKKLPRSSPAVNKEREFQCVTGACLLTPRELFLGSGSFDERFINCFEDVDYCLRIREMGYKVIYTPKAELTHYEGQTPGRKDGVMESDRVLREKWGNQMLADEWNYLEEEGFAVEEDDLGTLTIFPGQELQQWWRAIYQLMELDQFATVLDEIEKVEVIIGANHLHLCETRGKCHIALGDYQAARADYAKALTFDPKNPDLKWGLARVAIAEGKISDARKRLEKLIEAHPADERVTAWQTTLSQILELPESAPLKSVAESNKIPTLNVENL